MLFTVLNGCLPLHRQTEIIITNNNKGAEQIVYFCSSMPLYPLGAESKLLSETGRLQKGLKNGIMQDKIWYANIQEPCKYYFKYIFLIFYCLLIVSVDFSFVFLFNSSLISYARSCKHYLCMKSKIFFTMIKNQFDTMVLAQWDYSAAK